MLTQSRLKEIYEYNPETGIFFRRPDTSRSKWWNAKHEGQPAGWISAHGRVNDTLPYLRLRIDGKSYFQHRCAWLYMTGEWPTNEVDHVNGQGLDNRWTNLREATKTENAWNTGIRSNNTSGFKGVSWSKDRQKWVATITVNGKFRRIGRFDTIEEARAAYDAESAKQHGEFLASPERRLKETA